MISPNADVIPNIPRLFTALAEWCACLVTILHCPRRPGLSRVHQLSIMAVALPLQCLFLYSTGELPLGWWVPCMAGAVILMFFMIWICSDLSLAGGVYGAALAFLQAEFTAALEWQLWYYFASRHGLPLEDLWGVPTLFMLAVYGLMFVAFLLVSYRFADIQVFRSIRPLDLVVPLGIALASFLMGNLSFVLSNTPFSASVIVDIHTIRTLADFAGVLALLAYHIQCSRLRDREELAAIRSLLNAQYVQYQQSKDSLELIHRKYHDLKHQIAVLRAETDPQRRSAFLDGMEQDLREFEARNNTGNPVLDTVLTAKSMYCARNGIEFTCVADGAALNFMSALEISSLFGNLLDNAIQCEMDLPDPGQRLIRLSVHRKSSMLVVCCENYCPNPPELREDGLISTTRGAQEGHGYGLKSIRYTAQQYGGSMTIRIQDSWFSLTVLIPLPEAS